VKQNLNAQSLSAHMPFFKNSRRIYEQDVRTNYNKSAVSRPSQAAQVIRSFLQNVFLSRTLEGRGDDRAGSSPAPYIHL